MPATAMAFVVQLRVEALQALHSCAKVGPRRLHQEVELGTIQGIYGVERLPIAWDA